MLTKEENLHFLLLIEFELQKFLLPAGLQQQQFQKENFLGGVTGAICSLVVGSLKVILPVLLVHLISEGFTRGTIPAIVFGGGPPLNGFQGNDSRHVSKKGRLVVVGGDQVVVAAFAVVAVGTDVAAVVAAVTAIDSSATASAARAAER